MVDETEFDIMDADHESRLLDDDCEQLQRFTPEWRSVDYLMCPDCFDERPENISAIKNGSIIKCYRCGFAWIAEI